MVVAVCMQKGGTGKTTTAAVLAQAAARCGAKTLVIDLDPQGNLSQAFGARVTPDAGSSYKLLSGEPVAEQIQGTAQGIDIIPAEPSLSTITSGKGTARRLQEAIEPIRNMYDFITIDTPPTAGEMQYNALQAADQLVIPLQADIYNAQSLYQIATTARQIQKSNPRLQIAGIIFTQHENRTLLAKQLFRSIINKSVGELGLPYLGTVRASNAIRETAALQESLYKYAPRNGAAADYMDIFNEITEYQYA